MGMRSCMVHILVPVTVLAILTGTSFAYSLDLSKILKRSTERLNMNGIGQGDLPELDLPEVNKRRCQGFPCMYTHLGAKAGRASLYKALASFIDECFNDASCDPGRRKRGDISNQNALYPMPMRMIRRRRSSSSS